MYCTVCGSKIREGAKFCDECGTKINYVDGTPAHSTSNIEQTQQSISANPFGNSYANNIYIGGMNIIKYAGVWIGTIIISLLWLLAPIISPNNKSPFEIYMRYNNSEYIEEFNYSLPGVLKMFFGAIEKMSDGSTESSFFIVMLFGLAIVAIVLLGYAIATVVSLVRKNVTGINGNCQGFVGCNILMAIFTFVFVLVYNAQTGSGDGANMIQINYSIMGYVIPALALVLKFAILDRADKELESIGNANSTSSNVSESLFKDEEHIASEQPADKPRRWTCSSCGRENPIDSAHCLCGNKKSV